MKDSVLFLFFFLYSAFLFVIKYSKITSPTFGYKSLLTLHTFAALNSKKFCFSYGRSFGSLQSPLESEGPSMEISAWW